MATRRVKLADLKKAKGRTDFDKLDNLTDEEIEKAAREDPDSALPTEKEVQELIPARKRPAPPRRRE